MSKASTTDIIRIYELLKDVIVREDDGGVYYKEEWSDQRVADQLGVKKHTVMRVRVENFGKIFTSAAEQENAALRARIAELEAQLGEK